MTPIIETIILCGRQSIPLRGHRDSGPLTFGSEKNLEDNNNDGNLRALLRYRMKHDQVFKNDFLLPDATLSISAQECKTKLQVFAIT